MIKINSLLYPIISGLIVYFKDNKGLSYAFIFLAILYKLYTQFYITHMDYLIDFFPKYAIANFIGRTLYIDSDEHEKYMSIVEYIFKHHKNQIVNKGSVRLTRYKKLPYIVMDVNCIIKHKGNIIYLKSESFSGYYGKSKNLKISFILKSKNFETINDFLSFIKIKTKKNEVIIYNNISEYESIENKSTKVLKWKVDKIECICSDKYLYNDNIVTSFINDFDTFIIGNETKLNLLTNKRNYLFYGPPGCGKSFLIKSIGAEYNIPIFNFNMEGCSINDIKKYIYDIKYKKHHILLFEDFDRHFCENSDKEELMSFIFNVLDGINSVKNRIIIITTNHIEVLQKIDGLTRKGRIDRKVHFTKNSSKVVERIMDNYLPEQNEILKKYHYKEIKYCNLINTMVKSSYMENGEQTEYLRKKLCKNIKKIDL